jgi:hypothetical protein
VRPLADEEIFDAAGEGGRELCVFVETNEKKLVLRIGSFEKLQGGFL